MFMLRESLVSPFAAKGIPHAEEPIVCVVRDLVPQVGRWWEKRVRLLIPGPRLLSVFSQALGHFPPFRLQRFLPGKRQFHPPPGASPKGYFLA